MARTVPPEPPFAEVDNGHDRENRNRVAAADAVGAAQWHDRDTVWIVTNPEGPRDRRESEAHAGIRSEARVRGVALRPCPLRQPNLTEDHTPGVGPALFPRRRAASSAGATASSSRPAPARTASPNAVQTP